MNSDSAPQTTALLVLADRCEKEEASPIIDIAIAYAIGWTTVQFGAVMWRDTHHNERGIAPPTFTTSLDAAMALVPEGKDWHIGRAKGKYAAGIYHPGETRASWKSEEKTTTPALALCAAALRARASMKDEKP